MAAQIPEVRELDLLLVGKTGNGKSSSGNSILGDDIFESSDSGESVTAETSVRHGRRGNWMLKVIDTPGVFDTKCSNDSKKMVEFAVEKLSESFLHCPNGFHALVLVFMYPTRMTAEEIEAVNQLRKIFGEDFIKNHCVIIVTNGEGFDLKAKKRKYESFEKWCEEQDGTFGYLFQECARRVVLFYNLSDGEKKTQAVEKFLSLVSTIRNRYTNKEFDKWKMSRETLIVRAGIVQLKANFEPKIENVIKKLTEIKNAEESPEIMLGKMKALKVDVIALKSEIDREDRDTDVLKSLNQTVQNFDKVIDQSIQVLQEPENKNARTTSGTDMALTAFLSYLVQKQHEAQMRLLEMQREEMRNQNKKGGCIIS